jgi:hypothetical protein
LTQCGNLLNGHAMTIGRQCALTDLTMEHPTFRFRLASASIMGRLQARLAAPMPLAERAPLARAYLLACALAGSHMPFVSPHLAGYGPVTDGTVGC